MCELLRLRSKNILHFWFVSHYADPKDVQRERRLGEAFYIELLDLLYAFKEPVVEQARLEYPPSDHHTF